MLGGTKLCSNLNGGLQIFKKATFSSVTSPLFDMGTKYPGEILFFGHHNEILLQFKTIVFQMLFQENANTKMQFHTLDLLKCTQFQNIVNECKHKILATLGTPLRESIPQDTARHCCHVPAPLHWCVMPAKKHGTASYAGEDTSPSAPVVAFVPLHPAHHSDSAGATVA